MIEVCDIKDSNKLTAPMLLCTNTPNILGYLSTRSHAKNISKNNVKSRAIENFINLFNRPLACWVNTKKSFVKKANRIDMELANMDDSMAEPNISNVTVLVTKYTIVARMPKNKYFPISENKKYFIRLFICIYYHKYLFLYYLIIYNIYNYWYT